MFQRWWIEENRPKLTPKDYGQVARARYQFWELPRRIPRARQPAQGRGRRRRTRPRAGLVHTGAITAQEANNENPVPRMLVTLNNEGGTIERIELNRYADLEDQIAYGEDRAELLWNRAGYLGNLAPTKAENGVKIQIVPRVPPPKKLACARGDVIFALLDGKEDFQIRSPLICSKALGRCKPETEAILSVNRKQENGNVEPLKIKAKLGWRPAQVIRPELNTRPLPVVTEPNLAARHRRMIPTRWRCKWRGLMTKNATF